MGYGPFDLSGKVALVTGAIAALASASPRRSSNAGADVAIWGTNVGQERRGSGGSGLRTGRRVVALQCDVGDETAVEAAFAETLKAVRAG